MNAVVMVSIGRRPWVRSSAATFERYAEKYGLDLIRPTELPSFVEFPLPDLPDSPGRKNKAAYVCKQFFAWKALADYDRVAVVDDTCLVRPVAPSFFDVVPYGHCGYTHTDPKMAEESFGAIRQFIADNGEDEIRYDPALYMNSGVMVYDRTMRDALSPERIARCAPMLFSKFPDQAVVYYLLQRAKVPMHRMDKRMNTVPGLDLPSEDRRNMVDPSPYFERAFIHHITGVYRNRRKVIEHLSRMCLAEWDAA